MMKALYIMNDDTFDMVYPTDIRKEIEKLADVYATQLTEDMVKKDTSILKNVEIIFSGWGCPKMDQTFLEAAPNLKAVFYAAGSIKNIPTLHFWERDILITNAVNANAIPVIEYTLSQILFCLKSGWKFVRKVRDNKKYPNKSIPLAGGFRSTVGIISLSSIGRGVCELLKSFDIQVIAYDPFVKEEEANELGVELCSLDEVFQKSDIVSLHTPLLEETKGMIKGEHFQKMKPNASFINTARGAIVREKEMIDVLDQRQDIMAILDVTYPEPPVYGSSLYTLPNVVLTPHIAGSLGEECGRMGLYMLQEFKRYLNNETLRWQIKRKDFDFLA